MKWDSNAVQSGGSSRMRINTWTFNCAANIHNWHNVYIIHGYTVYIISSDPFRTAICLHCTLQLPHGLKSCLYLHDIHTFTLLLLCRAGTPSECSRNRTSFSPLWVCCQCHKSSGTNPCWRSRLTDARWCATPLRGTSITEKTSGEISFFSAPQGPNLFCRQKTNSYSCYSYKLWPRSINTLGNQ